MGTGIWIVRIGLVLACASLAYAGLATGNDRLVLGAVVGALILAIRTAERA